MLPVAGPAAVAVEARPVAVATGAVGRSRTATSGSCPSRALGASSNADAVAGLVAGCTAGVRALQTGSEKNLKESAFFLFAPRHAPAGNSGLDG